MINRNEYSCLHASQVNNHHYELFPRSWTGVSGPGGGLIRVSIYVACMQTAILSALIVLQCHAVSTANTLNCLRIRTK